MYLEYFSMFLSTVGTLALAYYFVHIFQMLWQMFFLWYKSFFKNNAQLRKRYGDWAVITGSTDGVGKQFAMEMAQRGINVVLISRTMDKLNMVAQEIELKHGVKTKVIKADFSEGTQVYSHIEEELQNIPVGILVNNVGVLEDHPMRVCDVPMEKIWEMINVNVIAAVSMTRLIVPAMVERGRGAVVNMSSASGWQAVPKLGIYSSTKAFINIFTSVLQEEYSQTNIDFSYIYPLFVSSKMTSFSENLTRGNIFVPDAVSFTKHAVNTLGTFSKTAGYWSHILKVELLLMLPTWARIKVASSMVKELEEEYLEKNVKPDEGKIKSIEVV